MALIGDAAYAVDPLAGIGCTWALQSARLLVHCTAASVQCTSRELDKALQHYRRRHWLWLAPQFFLITRFSRAKRFRVITRGLLRLVTRGLAESNVAQGS